MLTESFLYSGGWQDMLKGSGLLTLAGLSIFFIIKWKFVELISVETATVAVRTSWGRPRYHNRRLSKLLSWGVNNSSLFTELVVWAFRYSGFEQFVQRTGRLVVLLPGPHKVFRGWQGLIEVNLREIPLEFAKDEMTFRKRTLWYQPIVIVQVKYSDDRDGDRNLVNSIYSVRDTSTHDQAIENMKTKIKAVHAKAFAEIKSYTKPDKQGFPKFKLSQVKDEIADELLDLHGFETKEVVIPPMAWTEAQIRFDAQVKAAKIEARAKVQAANILAQAIRKEAANNPEERNPSTPPVGLAVAGSTLLDETA